MTVTVYIKTFEQSLGHCIFMTQVTLFSGVEQKSFTSNTVSRMLW